jgi:hypothetical protein
VELRNVRGSRADRCVLIDTTMVILWLALTALIFHSSRLQRLPDQTRPQKPNRNRDFLYETEPKSERSDRHNTTLDSVS